jgi:hypothetical protein
VRRSRSRRSPRLAADASGRRHVAVTHQQDRLIRPQFEVRSTKSLRGNECGRAAARKGGCIEHAHAAVADGVGVRKPDFRSSVCGSDSQERLDGTAFVHRVVGLDDAVQVGAAVEQAAGVDAAFEDVIEQLKRGPS